MKKSSKGFTLIELIIVIVLLGILSAFALPKFADLSGNANESVVQAMAGNIKAAVGIQHTIALINPGGTTNGYVSSDGILFDQGYPIGVSFGDADGIPEILEAIDFEDADFTYNTIFSDTGDAGSVARGLYITSSSVIASGASAAQIQATNCYVGFRSYVTVELPPDVEVVVTNC